MELRHLRYFLMVAETLHFGRAATRLGIAQPPLSRQIHDLESELGTRLFHRTSRGVVLTDAGVVFAQRAAQILSASDEAMLEAREAGTGRSGRLVIGFVHSLSYSMLPTVLPGFRQRYPGIHTSLREVNVADKETALLSEQIDIGIFRPIARHPEIDVLPINEEGFVLALPAEHPLARRRKVPVACLTHEDLILFRALRGDAGLNGTILSFLRQYDVAVRRSEEVGTIHAALGLVVAGAGISIVPETTMTIQVKGVVYRRFVESTTRVVSAICWRNFDTSLSVNTFLHYVRPIFGG